MEGAWLEAGGGLVAPVEPGLAGWELGRTGAGAGEFAGEHPRWPSAGSHRSEARRYDGMAREEWCMVLSL